MNILVIAAEALRVFYFDMGGYMHPIREGRTINIEHNRLWLMPRPLGPVEVIDSKGRDVVVSVEGNFVHMKAKERSGYPCGPMTVRTGGEKVTIILRSHHGPICKDHH